MSFEEFYVAALSVYQLEAREDWDRIADKGFLVDEMAEVCEMNLAPIALLTTHHVQDFFTAWRKCKEQLNGKDINTRLRISSPNSCSTFHPFSKFSGCSMSLSIFFGCLNFSGHREKGKQEIQMGFRVGGQCHRPSSPNQTLKQPNVGRQGRGMRWWWLQQWSRSMRSWMLRNSSTWHGMLMGPFWSKPNSSSASLRRLLNSGWFTCITGITNLCRSSPSPTSTLKNPLGTSLTSFL